MKKDNTHGVLSNVLFYMNIWRKTYLLGFLYMIMAVPISLISIYHTIRIPQIIIRGIEFNSDWKLVIQDVMISFSIMMVLSIILKIINNKLSTRGTKPLAWLYSNSIHKKLFSLDYEKLLSPSVQNKLSKVQSIIFRGAGDGGPVQFFGFYMSALLVSIAGIVLFSPNIIKIDWVLLLAIFISAIINFIYSLYSGKYSTKLMRDRSPWLKKETYFLKTCEDKAYSKDIRFYELLSPISEAYKSYHSRLAYFIRRETMVHFGAGLLNAITLLIRDGLAYSYLISKLIAGSLTISEFVFLIALVRQFSLWMDIIISNSNQIIMFSARMEQLRDFLDIEDGIKEGTLSIEGVSAKPTIEFSNLSYHYPGSDSYIFKDFSLKIKSGEKIALVGINGAGKTSLMHLLMGLLHPVEGKILIDGRDSRDFIRKEYYKLFSPVFQDTCIFPESITQNISGSPSWDQDRLNLAIKGAGFDEFINSLNDGVSTELVRESSEKAIDLSGGMNQRMLLARALYKDARINILDEPTAALDPLAESKMYEEYNRMSKGKTSIFISHRLASTRFCDRIILLENGKIIEEGTHDNLMEKNGQYAQMYSLQSKYYQDKEEAIC